MSRRGFGRRYQEIRHLIINKLSQLSAEPLRTIIIGFCRSAAPSRGAHNDWPWHPPRRARFGGLVVPAGYKALNSFVRDDENALDPYQSIEKMTDNILTSRYNFLQTLHNLLILQSGILMKKKMADSAESYLINWDNRFLTCPGYNL